MSFCFFEKDESNFNLAQSYEEAKGEQRHHEQQLEGIELNPCELNQTWFGLSALLGSHKPHLWKQVEVPIETQANVKALM